MRVAGEKLGYSSSYISQIENGRENVPTSIKLDAFLDIYKSTNREFKALARKAKPTDYDLIQELLPKLSAYHLRTVRQLVETMVQA